MGYYIDLELISIDWYREKLKSGYLPPSRMILKERTDERLEYFKSINLKNLKELHQTLKKKDQLLELSKADCLSEEYLNMLLREINGILPKPNKIKEFFGILRETVLKLEKIGIQNTQKLYDKVLTKALRKELSETTGISKEEILKLTKLTDLSRIKWVGVNYARALYDIGVDTVEKISKADPLDLYERVNAFMNEKNIFKGKIGLNDIRILIECANEVPQEIEY